MNEIAVSIICLTYNQRDYIKDALEGFVTQETNFTYEILVHDDASTDGTTEILKKYEKQYSDKIRLFLEKENQYSKGVSIARKMALHAKGKYMAYCEGDDFWIYSGKLQKQYELMESDQEISLCYHNALVYGEEKDTLRLNVQNHPSGYIEDKDIICASKGWYPTASLFCRTDSFKELPDFKGATGDVVWRTCMACRGKLYFINRAWSVYRDFSQGSWNEKYRQDRKVAARYIIDTVNYFTKFDVYSKRRFSKYLHTVYIASVRRLFRVNYPDGYTVEQFEDELSALKRLSDHKADRIIDAFHDEYIVHSVDYYTFTVINKIKDLALHGERIYIYGAGAEAIKAIVALCSHNIRITGLLVSKKEAGVNTLLGYTIYSINEIEPDSHVFVWPCLIDGREEVLNILGEMPLYWIC